MTRVGGGRRWGSARPRAAQRRGSCPSAAPRRCAPASPPVVGRVEDGRCLLDLRCVPRRTTTMLGWPPAVPACTSSRPPGTSTTASPRWSGAHRDGARPLGRGAPARPDHRPRVRLDDVAGRATVAFVDVPGHERFVGNMLAGVGPVPAVMFVVAADEGWMPQSDEHLAALDALGVRHGLLVITQRSRRSGRGDRRGAGTDSRRRRSARSPPSRSARDRRRLDELRRPLPTGCGRRDRTAPTYGCGSTGRSPSRRRDRRHRHPRGRHASPWATSWNSGSPRHRSAACRASGRPADEVAPSPGSRSTCVASTATTSRAATRF